MAVTPQRNTTGDPLQKNTLLAQIVLCGYRPGEPDFSISGQVGIAVRDRQE
jgi:hypothetical protein